MKQYFFTKKMQSALLTLTFSMFAFAAFAQQATLKGNLTDAGGSKESLIGASVAEGKTGTATDENGNYQLQLAPGAHRIEFSYIGYESVVKNVTVKANETVVLDVTLGEMPNILTAVTKTATRYEKPLGEVTVSLEVIKTNLIENASTPSIDKTIEKVPGVTIIDGQANIRGGSGYSYGAGSRVLLLVNDMPILQSDAGFPNWNDVPVENIEQVEIVKGAASALYGSSALNGIINIRTAFAKSDPVTKLSTFITGYDTPANPNLQWWGGKYKNNPFNTPQPMEYSSSIAHRQKFGKFDLAIGGYYRNNNSFRRGEKTEYGRINAFTRYRVTDRLSIGLNANANKGNSASFFLWDGDSSKAYLPLCAFCTDATRDTSEVLTRSKTFRTSIDPYINYTDKNGNSHKLMTRWLHIVNDNSNNQSNNSDFLYGEYQFARRLENLDLNVVAGLVGSSNVTVAQLYGNSTIKSSNSAAYLQLDKRFHFGKPSVKWNNLNISVGARYEMNQIDNPLIYVNVPTLAGAYRDTIQTATVRDARPVFRAGVNYQPAQFTYVRASWGQGYRYPTIAEKFITTSVGGLGIFPNPRLTPETGWSAEIGVKQGVKISNWMGYIDASYFRTEYQNMMEFTFGGGDPTKPLFGFQSINIGDTEISGLDFTLAGEGKLFGKKTQILAGYTYVNPKFKQWEAIDRDAQLLNAKVLNQGQSNFANSAIDQNILKYRFRHSFKVDAEIQVIKQMSMGVSYNFMTPMENIDRVFMDKNGVGTILVPGFTNDPVTDAAGAWQNDFSINKITIFDARIAWTPTEKIRIAFIAKNILNKQYSLRPSLIEAPRNYTLRADFTF